MIEFIALSLVCSSLYLLIFSRERVDPSVPSPAFVPVKNR